jgi:hypothetical protein
VELVFVVVYRLDLLVFSPEKAAVERWRDLQKADGERRKMETRGKLFFVIFGPDVLLHQAMKSTSIYRRWKRAILSTQGKNFQPLIRLGRIPTVGSK